MFRSTSTTTGRRRLLTGATMIAAVIGTLMTATSAQAAGRDGACDPGEFCYYYNSNQAGSVSDFTGSVADYATTTPSCYVFKGSGAGQGRCIKNNAASVWNNSSVPVTVYFNTGYSGTSQTVAPGVRTNLVAALKNNNASHRFGTVAVTKVAMSAALYGTSGGRLTCGFDGYTTTPGRHEGIDFARGIGAGVYALLDGTVTRVARGTTGSSGLSTIAVYNAANNKTIVYLHSAPVASLAVGQTISRGQLIATESWRGISSAGSAHTHVEMRLGRQTYAAKSVNDPVLDNPNPTSFWNSVGYDVR